MSFCPFCGKELSEEESQAKFCAYCGKPLSEAPEANAPAETTTEGTVNAETVNTESTSSEQPQLEKTPVFDVDDIKAKVLPALDKCIEKAKTVPFLNKLLSKLDEKLYPVLLAVPVALLVLIIVIVMAVSSSGSYMTPLNDFMRLANKSTADDQKLTYSLSPDFRVNLLKKIDSAASKADSYKDSIEDTNDELEDSFEELDDEFDKWKIKFEVKSKEKLDKDDIEDLNDDYDDYYDDYIDSYIDKFEDILDDDDDLEDFADSMDISEKEAQNLLKAYINYYKSFKDVKITEAYEVKGKFIVNTDDDDYKTETVKLTFVKINGDWAYAGCDGSLSLEDSDGYFDFIFDYLETSYLSR